MKNEMLANIARIKSEVTALEAQVLLLPDEMVAEPEPTPDPEPTPPADDEGAFLPMRVRDVTLTDRQVYWLAKTKATKSWSDPAATYNMEQLASTGRLQDISRHLTLMVPAVLAALRVTGDIEVLEKVYRISQNLRGTLDDDTGDGFREWLQTTPDGSLGALEGTDESVMEDIMAHALIAQLAWLFRLNAELDPKYGAESDFWLEYLVGDFEAKWRQRSNKPTGYPFIQKDLMHPFANSVKYMGYMVRLTGDSERKAELERLLGILHRQLCHDGPGKLVWMHGVNELRAQKDFGWMAQPAGGYAGETAQALAELGFEGWLNHETMTKIARAVSENILDGKSPGIGARTILGDVSRMVYSPFHGKDVRLNMPELIPKYERMKSYSWQARGYPLLSGEWDASGKIAALSRGVANNNDVYPQAAAGGLLGAGQ